MNDMTFETEVECELWNDNSKDTEIDHCIIDWEFDCEFRSYGMKTLGILVKSIKLSYSELDDDGDAIGEEHELIITREELYDKWKLNVKGTFELGHIICPQSCDIDYNRNTITVEF